MTEERRAERRLDAAAKRARARGHVLKVTCPACKQLVDVPYLLSIETVGGALVDARLRNLPFEHKCPKGGI